MLWNDKRPGAGLTEHSTGQPASSYNTSVQQSQHPWQNPHLSQGGYAPGGGFHAAVINHTAAYPAAAAGGGLGARVRGMFRG